MSRFQRPKSVLSRICASFTVYQFLWHRVGFAPSTTPQPHKLAIHLAVLSRGAGACNPFGCPNPVQVLVLPSVVLLRPPSQQPYPVYPPSSPIKGNEVPSATLPEFTPQQPYQETTISSTVLQGHQRQCCRWQVALVSIDRTCCS
jgi:hypothetical protein